MCQEGLTWERERERERDALDKTPPKCPETKQSLKTYDLRNDQLGRRRRNSRRQGRLWRRTEWTRCNASVVVRAALSIIQGALRKALKFQAHVHLRDISDGDAEVRCPH